MNESAIAFAIRMIKSNIPIEILNEVFVNRSYQVDNRPQFATLSTQIQSAVIDNEVLLDTQLVSGRETSIELGDLPIQVNADNTVTIHIPLSRTHGRYILDIYRVDFTSLQNNLGLSTTNVGDSLTNRMIHSVVDGSVPMDISSTTHCELIAPNTILVDMDGTSPNFTRAEVSLTNDKSMSHVRPKAYRKFGELCVLRTKQYIYNKLIIPLDAGMLYRGKEIGVFKSIIDNYSDAHVTYGELLQSWSKTEFIQDREKMTKYLKLITPSI